MSYEFPPKRLHNTDVPDPAPLTKNLQPAARRLSELRAHNIDASDFKANGVIARSAYWKHFYGKATTGPGLSGADKIPTQAGVSSPDAKVDIPPDFSWHTVVATSAAVDCRAGDKLWINAGCVWSSEGYTGASTPLPYPPCGFYKGLLQFALRINGVIIEETITGKGNLAEGPVQAWRQPDTEVLGNTVFTALTNKGGVGLPKYTIKVYHQTNTTTLNRPGPVKVYWVLEVPDGSHTVELVARRIANQRHQRFVLHPRHAWTSEAAGDDLKTGWVSVYNRQISVLKLRQGGPNLGSDVVSIGAFDDGDVLSATELLTNRLEPMRVQANDLAAAALRGPALIRSHLPTGIIATEQLLTTSFAGTPFTNVWPGYATADFAPTPGWQTLTELIANNGGAGWNAAANECTIHLHANIEVSLIEEGTGGYGGPASNVAENRIWALLCLYERQGGTYTPIKVSEVFIPSCIADFSSGLGFPAIGLGYAKKYGELRRDAPLMAVLEHPTASGPTYTEFGVAIAIYSESGLSLTHRVHLSRGSLQVFQIRS